MMTTRVTKWNHDRCLRSREVVDETRKGHRTPPLVLNPLQYSELVKLAAVGDGKDVDDPVEGTIPNKKEESVSQSSRVVKQQGKIPRKVSARPKPVDEMSSISSTAYGSLSSASVKTHNSLENRQKKPKDNYLKVSADHLDKVSSLTEKSSRGISSLDGSLEKGKISISSKSNTLEDYNFPGLEHAPEMKQLLALRAQLHAMKLQTKQQAQETAGELKQTREHPELVPDNPHYTRWEPKLLHEEFSNKKLYEKWKNLRPKGRSQKKREGEESAPDQMDNTEDGTVKDQEGRSCSSIMSATNQTDPNAALDSYSKAVFQRGGEFEQEKIRKRYVYSKTYWLKGDGYDREERDNWVQKPVPEYVSTYKVQPGDVRYCRRSRSASTLSTRHSDASKADSKRTLADYADSIYDNERERNRCLKGRLPDEGDRKGSGNEVNHRNRCQSAVEENTAGGERVELPHQRHHDFRRLKDIFRCPRPTYDRLQRDRETLTQHEKELLMLQNMKRRAKQQQEAIKIAEEELRHKEEVTPGQRSAALLKQVKEGRVQQLVEKAQTLQERLQEERKWDRKVQLQQRQHLHRLQQKEHHKAERQERMRAALTKLVGERHAREHMEREAATAERDKQRLQHVQHRQHQKALLQQQREEKKEALRHLQEDLEQAMGRHDERDLHYAVARRKEYRSRKRDKHLHRAPSPLLRPSEPCRASSPRGGIPNTSMFQTVGGQRD